MEGPVEEVFLRSVAAAQFGLDVVKVKEHSCRLAFVMTDFIERNAEVTKLMAEHWYVRARLALCEPGAGRRAQPECCEVVPPVRRLRPSSSSVGDDDGLARVRGSGGDDGGGSGGGSDCAFLRSADHGGAS